jgi:hypothetical protein
MWCTDEIHVSLPTPQNNASYRIMSLVLPSPSVTKVLETLSLLAKAYLPFSEIYYNYGQGWFPICAVRPLKGLIIYRLAIQTSATQPHSMTLGTPVSAVIARHGVAL